MEDLVSLVGVNLMCFALASLMAHSDSFIEVAPARDEALKAERNMDWKEAFDEWEQILDRSTPTEEQRLEAVAHVHDLNTKVPPENTNPQSARPWPTLVVVFRHMNVNWTDKQGVTHHFHSTFSDQEVALVSKAVATFGDYVFRYTSGNLRIETTIKIVDEAVNNLQGHDGVYWVGPEILKPTLTKLVGKRQFQSIFVYEKFNQGDQTISLAYGGASYLGYLDFNRAAFSEILWVPYAPTNGEVELHEWLHQINWMFTEVLGYPPAASVDPDSMRKIGEEGGDADYRRPESALNWMDFYVHIMQDHITRRMWHEATMHDQAPNPWLAAKSGKS